MSSPMQNLQILNSFVRTVLGVAVVGGIGTAGYVGYTTYNASDLERRERARELTMAREALADSEAQILELGQRVETQAGEIVELNDEVVRQAVEIERLDTSLQLHKMQRRLAQVTVLDVDEDPDSGERFSRVKFVELNDLGDPIGEAKEYRLQGDVIYLDYLVVKFDDQYVEQADLERGTSICTFTRLFGEHQKPLEGFTLDQPGQRPGNYAQGGKMSDYEKQIWEDFWTIANDPERASELGIRALHGEAVSMKVQKGKTYRVTVRASGGPELEVVD